MPSKTRRGKFIPSAPLKSVGETIQLRWMPMDKWDRCAFPVDAESLRGRICYGGLDLSSTTDVTAFVLVFPAAG